MNEFNQEVTYNVNEVSACTLIAQALAYMNDNQRVLIVIYWDQFIFLWRITHLLIQEILVQI